MMNRNTAAPIFRLCASEQSVASSVLNSD